MALDRIIEISSRSEMAACDYNVKDVNSKPGHSNVKLHRQNCFLWEHGHSSRV